MDSPKPVSLRISLPFATEQEFIDRYGTNLAKGGIFIATRAIKPEGTPLAFELVLSEGTRLLRGEGVVQRVQVDPGNARSGMTVRFTKLDASSKALIDRVLAGRSKPAEAPAPPPSPSQPPPSAREHISSPPRKRSLPEVPALPAMPASEEVVLGIDLGTTNCRAAVYVDGAARLVPLGDSRTTSIPSVVAIDDKDNVLVGTRAKGQILSDPQHTVYGAKRLLGRRARSKRIRELAMRFPYKVTGDEHGDAAVELRGKVVPIAQVCALMLGELKAKAQELIGREVRRAVLCVPAYFDDHQRGAMYEAGRRAGLSVMRILSEPSAVALAYGYGRGLTRKRVLVYDLGGGTFDASVLEVTGDDLEVLTTGGENFLGGLDFDHRLAEQLSLSLTDDERARVNGSLHALQRVRDAAEQAKISLSDEDRATVNVPFAAMRSDGTPVDLRTEVSRGTLEEVTEDLVERTIEVTEAVLEAGGLTPKMIDEVLVVGGQSRAPMVKRRLSDFLGRPIRTELDAHGAVALGAAIMGRALLQKEKGKAGVLLSEVLGAPIGYAQRDGSMRLVLERNTRLPAQKTFTLAAYAGQVVGLAIFQGASKIAEQNEYLGLISVSCDRAGELSLNFSISPDGRLEVTAKPPSGKATASSFATAEASDEIVAGLLAQAPMPEPSAGEAAQGGLLRSFKRLLGRG